MLRDRSRFDRARRVALRAWIPVGLAAIVSGFATPARAEVFYLIVAGLGGEERYAREFDQTARSLEELVGTAASRPDQVLRLSGEAATRKALRAALEEFRDRLGKDDALVVVLIGHGSYDGLDYKLNLPGPDLAARELAERLDAIQGAQLVVNATSASGGSIDALRAQRRVVITATRSGSQRNATVFGARLAEVLADPQSDLDRDGWVSADEAFEVTRRAVTEYYAREVRLATENARVEGGDGRAFRLARTAGRPLPTTTGGPEPVADARVARLLREIEALRARKSELGDERYYEALEQVLVALAELEADLETRPQDPPGAAPATGVAE